VYFIILVWVLFKFNNTENIIKKYIFCLFIIIIIIITNHLIRHPTAPSSYASLFGT